MRIATVFSGIGAIEQALLKLGINFEIVFACDSGERYINIDEEKVKVELSKMSYFEQREYIKKIYNKSNKINYVKQTYFANYDISEDKWFDDIRFIDGNQFKNKVDLFVGGSPCQSFSIIGKRAGLEDARGTLFYEYARLVKEIEPEVFIYENVPGMLTHDKGNTWKVIKDVFNSLGYTIYDKVLNSKDFGIPQDRKRLFVVGFKGKNNRFKFPKPMELTSTLFDYLQKDNIEVRHYLGKKGFEFVTNPKYKARARVNSLIIQTQKANQQFNWNGDFVFEEIEKIANPDILKRAFVGEFQGKIGVIRQLTYRECLRLMGFPDTFKIVVPNVPSYRQAGNSIVVNVLEEIIKEIMKVSNIALPKINVATVFSGIGAIEYALKRKNIDHEIIFACDTGEREIEYDSVIEFEKVKSLETIDEKQKYVEDLYNSKTSKTNYVQISYLHNYPHCPKNRYFQDIRLLDGRDFENKVDLFVGGSPCQSFSTVGHQLGLEDARGTLFYEFARLVKEIKPKVFIYENVRGLITHDKGKTWEVIKRIFESLGYKIYFDVLNAKDYGIPQNRRRLFVVGFSRECDFMMPQAKDLSFSMKDFLIDNCDEGYFSFEKDGTLKLEKVKGNVDNKYFLTQKLYDYVMKGGTKTFYQKPEINKEIARTLLKTMGNRHRAGIDNYVSSDGSNDFGKVRMLTEREALRLMGFTDDFEIVVSKAQMYKQAGNSIVVDVLINILEEIINTKIFEGVK